MSDEQYVYGLRTCNADMTAYNGFVWTREGPVEAPDWNPAPVCGGGLHFLRNGEGNAGLLSDKDDAVWMVVKADAAEIVDIDHAKSKARRCEVVFAGSKEGAVSLLRTLVGPDKKIPFVSEAAGDSATQTAGDRSTQTAGDSAIQTAGYRSTQTAGDRSTQTAGDRSTQTAGDSAIQTAGYRSTQTAGDRSTQTAGDSAIQTAGYRSTQAAGDSAIQTAGYRSTQTAGDRSTQTAGDSATQTAGYKSTQTAGYKSTQTAGEGSVFITRWWDEIESRYRVAVAIVGKDGTLKPNTPYRCENGVWAEVEPAAPEGGVA